MIQRCEVEYVELTCTRSDFHPVETSRVRWLDWEQDYELARTMWPDESPLSRETWLEAKELGYRYCGIVDRRPAGQPRLLSIAAVWHYSKTAWEAAAGLTARHPPLD